MTTTFHSDLRDLALRAGAAGFGVCDASPFAETEASLRARVAAGHSGGLSFTFSKPDRSTDISVSLPWARRLVVCSVGYLPDAGTPRPAEGEGRLARFAVGRPYEPLRVVLEAVAARLRTDGHLAEIVADDNRLVDRAAAVRAGVGWWGKNTMVLDPRHGPWLLLGSVVTDAALDTDEPMQRSCGTCQACLPACPTGALIEPGVLDATRCLAYHLQVADDIPSEFRTAMGDRVYGCDDCLEACPPGRRSLESAADNRGTVDLVALLAMTDDELLATYDHLYIPRRRPEYLRRNALVALGNSGTSDHVPLLARIAGGPDPMLQRHAIWAIGRIGGPAARRVLGGLVATPDTEAELVAALAAAE